MEETPTMPLFKTGLWIHNGDSSVSSGSTHSVDASEEKHREAKHQLELERQAAVMQEQEKTDAVVGELESTKQELEVELSENEVLKARVELHDRAERQRHLQHGLLVKESSLEVDLNAMEMSKSQALQIEDAQKCTMREQLLDEMAGYKTQAEQYAITIAALEGKLLTVMDRYQQLTDENEALKQNLQSITDSPANRTENQGTNEQQEKLQNLVGVLRNQLSLASKDGHQKQARLQQLEVDIQCLRAEMLDHEAELQDQYSKEFGDFRLKLARQEEIIQAQQEEIEQLKQALKKMTNQLAGKEQECEQVSDELARVKRKTENGTHTQATKTHQHLLKVGQRCLGEKHEEVLANQKSAITQFRQRLSDLELAKPPGGSHQATLKELSRVRHDLLLVKAERAGTAREDNTSMTSKIGKMTNSMLQTDLQCDFADMLHSTEKSYRHLVDTLCASLPVDRPSEKEIELTDNESLRQEVIRARYKFAETIGKRLKGEKPSGHSPDDSNDGVEFHSAEDLHQKTDPLQTITELEALLSSTVEELEQQRCLNQALLKRKNFKELQCSEASRRPRHNCTDQP